MQSMQMERIENVYINSGLRSLYESPMKVALRFASIRSRKVNAIWQNAALKGYVRGTGDYILRFNFWPINKILF